MLFGALTDSFVFPDESSTYLAYSFDNANKTATVTSYTGTISHVTIPTSVNGYRVTSIGNSAFYDNDNLTSVTIPKSVTSIGENAFWNCSNLTSITIPDSVTEIGSGAFTYCSNTTIYVNWAGDNQPSGWSLGWNVSGGNVVQQ